MSPERLDATVRGRVQGVGFRYFVIHRAMDLDLTGWVANEPDGTVRCVAEGPRRALDRLLEALQEGPAGALVERVTTAWGPATREFASFDVRSGGHRGD
ncbi:MAG TPA: acylphosphatase [Candidatus Limnocylindrales bacterium]|nr:acylphosphatase [Candidatus Limnocylindrales bacterium]